MNKVTMKIIFMRNTILSKLNNELKKKLGLKYLDSFEMWCRIKWPKKLTNEQALEHVGEKKTLLSNILCRKAN